MTRRSWCVSLAAVVASIGAAVTPAHAEGVDPCIDAAKADFKACKADCRETYQLAKDTCANRDHACVESCRADRDACRTPIVSQLAADLAGCQADLESARATCRSLYADGTPERDTCIDNAQVAAFQCRDAKREVARPGLKACRAAFKSCVRTNCPPLTVPDPAGIRACKAEARDVFVECAADCVEAKQLARDTCLDRDHACVEECRADRAECLTAPLATRASDFAACKATRDGAVANCPPPGDPARDACIDAAQVVAFQCRDDARERVHDDIALCRDGFRTCAQVCPPPPAP
jgi:hypothetical protein